MTPDAAPAPASPAPGAPPTVVAVCRGHRCSALLDRSQPDAMEVLRRATQDSCHGVLVSTGCAGPCSHAPVVVVGTGADAPGGLQVRPDAVLGPVGPAEVRRLAAHLADADARAPR